ncbi:MAG: YegP family protein [Candidatus Andersenbacteria bacterium]|nr:YegP family protein [Candidatus Andersenbacteria bacterium]
MTRKPKIEKNQAKNGEFYLTIKSANNRKVMTSGETYKNRQSLDTALKAAKRIIKGAEVVDNTKKKKATK